MIQHDRTAKISATRPLLIVRRLLTDMRAPAWLSHAMAELRRLATATPLGFAMLLVGLFVAIGALAASSVSQSVTALITRQIAETLVSDAAGLQDLDRIGGLTAVRSAIEARVVSDRAAGTGPDASRRLYLLVDSAGQRLAGTLKPDSEAEMRGAVGGMFRATIATPAARTDARWAVGVPVALSFGARAIVARDVEDVRAFAERLRWMLLAALGAIAAVGIGLGIAASRQVLARIETVTRTTDQIIAGNLTRRIPITGTGDEVDNLSIRLNSMLDRIEQLLSGMREISDNIAHDLKTPLSRLRNRAEAALRDPAGAAAHRDGLERTIEAADDIITTFNALLLIARLEAGAVAESFSPFDVAGLVRDLAELYQPVAEEAHIAFAVDVPDTIMINGNRQLIGQAVANLIDNAIKYGRADGGDVEAAIAVRLRLSGGDAVLTVADRGPGIRAEDRGNVLRRFVRLDQSRTAPGTGLGLSLVAAVARLHTARLTLGDNGPGLIVELALPLAAGATPATVAGGGA